MSSRPAIRWWWGVGVAGVLSAAFLHAQVPAAVPGAGIAWARIPPGTFDMGCVASDTRCDPDERPVHAVTVSRAFDLMTTETTVGMYRTTASSMREQPVWSNTDDQPVTTVRWDDARRFCTAIGGRLPTEAEWEYAARGGRRGGIYPWGDQEPTDRPGSINGAQFEGDGAKKAALFAPNGFGLHDMAGNAWEWVADWYGPYQPDSVADPVGPSTGRARVVRGGSYGDDSANLRVSNRSANLPMNANVNIGFRCARDVPTP